MDCFSFSFVSRQVLYGVLPDHQDDRRPYNSSYFSVSGFFAVCERRYGTVPPDNEYFADVAPSLSYRWKEFSLNHTELYLYFSKRRCFRIGLSYTVAPHALSNSVSLLDIWIFLLCNIEVFSVNPDRWDSRGGMQTVFSFPPNISQNYITPVHL